MASMIKCPTCGLALSEAHTTCPYDGTPLAGELDRTMDDPDLSGAQPGSEAPAPQLRPRPSGQKPIPGAASAAPVEAMARRSRELPARPAVVAELSAEPLPSGSEKTVVRSQPQAPPEHDPLIGQQLGEYVVKERIGMGGMGLVYRGEQPLIGKPVAIKILRPDVLDKAIHMERLLSEARAVNAVRHRGIIDIFSFGQTPDGRQYFVMELLDGMPLESYIAERGVLTPQEAIGISEEILAALHAAHEAGVIHRDLKPNNIFRVKQPGGGFYVKVLDFGLAKLGKSAAPATSSPQSVTGLLIGTPEYMAPEQIRGAEVTPKTDLYAFGIIAFQMLTGRMPFNATTPAECLVMHLHQAPPAPIDVQPDVPQALSDLVLALMAKDPAARPSMADVRAQLKRIGRALAQISTDVDDVQPPGPPPPAPRAVPSVPPKAQLRPSLPPARMSGARFVDTLAAPAAQLAPQLPASATDSEGALPESLSETLPESASDHDLAPAAAQAQLLASEAPTVSQDGEAITAPEWEPLPSEPTTDPDLKLLRAGRGKVIVLLALAVALIALGAAVALRPSSDDGLAPVPISAPAVPEKPVAAGNSVPAKDPAPPSPAAGPTQATPAPRAESAPPAQDPQAKAVLAAGSAPASSGSKVHPGPRAEVRDEKKQLLAYIDQLEHQLKSASLSEDERRDARSFLKKARLRAQDPQLRADVYGNLRVWERQYLRR